ncbi:MAG: NAD(P)/FAD-dependent oxidoreductase [Candidatus Lokiarchaeota archaeon]|nr:NAD(P)/FAD-dependent oxidoreductase [Candidatus Lokiarchaeota archaeon]
MEYEKKGKDKIENFNDQNNFDIIIIGAGPGGSAIGALLAKKGLNILIVDKNPRAGGRMMTIHKDGFHYELFPLNGVPQRNSHFEQILKEIGKENEVEVIYPDPIGLILYEDANGKIRKWKMGSNFLKMLRTFGVRLWNLKELFQSIRIFAKLARVSPKEIEELYDTSSMEYMDQFSMPQGIYTYLLATFGEGAFEITSDKSSAAEMIKLFQNIMKNGGGRYYKNGIGYVFEVYAKAVEEFGGKVLFNTRVEKISVNEKNKVTGIVTKDGKTYSAPVVISNAGLRQTVLKLVGKEHFSKEYIEWIKNLEHNLACVGYRWILNKPVLTYPTYVLYPEGCVAKYSEFLEMAEGELKPEKSYIYLGTTSVYPGLAPEGKQLVYACMSCLPDPELDIEPYLEYVEKKVRKILPELFDHIERTETFGPRNVPSVGTDIILPGQGGESYGLALTVGQTGEKQPKGDSPIEGLFHVGCDAGGSGLGTHQALDSALNVQNLVLDYMKMNQLIHR